MSETFTAIAAAIVDIDIDWDQTIGAVWRWLENDSPFDGFEIEPKYLRDPHFLGWLLSAVRDRKRVAFYRGRETTNSPVESTQTFTPRALVDVLFDDLGLRDDEHVHDPCCGGGQFLIAAFERRVSRGVPPEVALGRLSGADIDVMSVRVTRESIKIALFRTLGYRDSRLETLVDLSLIHI